MKWFESWFDSPFYHELYQNRDYKEAELFLKKLVKYLKIKKSETVLDLACGAGRHSHFLASKGLNVCGVDLSENSILKALKEPSNAEFYVHDMRNQFRSHYFNYVLNLFTSFGYFENDRDNIKVLNATTIGLKNDGILVIDFMNTEKVIANLVKKEKKVIGNNIYNITRQYDGKHIEKQINIESNGKSLHFHERVRAFKLSDFKSMLNQTNFTLVDYFGNYNLESYKAPSSDRLILICKKN